MLSDTNPKPTYRREYLTMAIRLWGTHIAGPVLALIAILSAIASAIWWNDPSILARIARWSGVLTGLASVILVFVAQYDAWLTTRKQLESEERRHEGSDIHGNIVLGYLETKSARLSPSFEHGVPGQGSVRYSWPDLPEKECWVCFFVDAVNRNSTPARFRAEKGTVEVTIEGIQFHGKWQHIVVGLAVDDVRRSDVRLLDIFDGWFAGRQGLELGVPWFGDIAFLVEPFDRSLTRGKDSIDADVKVSIYDTLEKAHIIETKDVELCFDKLHIHGEPPTSTV